MLYYRRTWLPPREFSLSPVYHRALYFRPPTREQGHEGIIIARGGAPSPSQPGPPTRLQRPRWPARWWVCGCRQAPGGWRSRQFCRLRLFRLFRVIPTENRMLWGSRNLRLNASKHRQPHRNWPCAVQAHRGGAPGLGRVLIGAATSRNRRSAGRRSSFLSGGFPRPKRGA